MTSTSPNTVTFLRHLTSNHAPFLVRRTGTIPSSGDQPLHDSLYRQAPDLYALCGLVDQALPEQQARILFQVLVHSRAEMWLIR